MDSDRELTAWEELGNRRAVTAAPSTPPSASSRVADFTDLIPSSDEEILTELASCLQLVAPVGMGEDEQDTWFEAALKALAGIPLGLLQRGPAAARLRADHPAKIIPAINAEIAESWEWRKNFHNRQRAPEPEKLIKRPDMVTAEEAQEICARFKIGSHAAVPASARRPQPVGFSDPAPLEPHQIRIPNKGDYERLFGIDPETERARAAALQAANEEADRDLLVEAHRLQLELYRAA